MIKNETRGLQMGMSPGPHGHLTWQGEEGLEEGIGKSYRSEFRASFSASVPVSLSHQGPLACPLVPSSHTMEAAAFVHLLGGPCPAEITSDVAFSLCGL